MRSLVIITVVTNLFSHWIIAGNGFTIAPLLSSRNHVYMNRLLLSIRTAQNNDSKETSTTSANKRTSSVINENAAGIITKNDPNLSTSQRRISHMEKYTRLPVWPAWNGALLFMLSKVLPNSIIAKLEDQFGGRVCPNFFPDDGSTSPFIMLVHHVHSFTVFDPLRWFQKNVILPEGFPSHPHRGFITLTYCLRGGMVHRDSIGYKQTYGNEKRHNGNFAQWLVTGAGILHEEMWDINHEQDGICSEQELFQLWINVPSSVKMNRPAVYLLSNNNVEKHSDTYQDGNIKTGHVFSPIIVSPDGDVETKVLVGEYINDTSVNHVSSSIPLDSAMTILHVTMKPNTSWSMKDIPPSYRTAMLYMRKGSLQIASQDEYLPAHFTAYLTPFGNEINAKAGSDGADFLLLAGEPINEPIQARGSMVMNSFDEIDQAYNDYSNGLMGRPWSQDLQDDQWRDHVNKYPSAYR